MARPTKFTDEIADEIVGGIVVGLTDKDAALAAGICEKTLERWRKRYAGFDDRIMRARVQRTRGWLQGIRKIATEDRDLRAYESLLDRCAPDYRKSTTVKHEGEITVNVRQEAEKEAARLTALGIPTTPEDLLISEEVRG
jgi:hypothetical protein